MYTFSMRIGIDCRLWNETGVGRYTRNLVRELASRDSRNTYASFVLPKDEEEVLQSTGGKWKIIKTNLRWHTIEEQLQFPEILLNESLDLVHFPYFSVPILYSRPFVVTIHDLIIHHFPTGKSSTLPYPFYWLKLQGYKYIISQAAKKSSRVISVSRATKKEIVDHLHIPETKVSVIYEGVDRNIVSHEKSVTGSSNSEKYFLYVGNAYPHKNLERLISAFRIVHSSFPICKLFFAGRNDFFYRRMSDEKKPEGVQILHVSSDAELARLYKNASALVMPSLMEGFGLPPLEAMANGCVVLASDIPSLREICNNAAIYFDPRDVKNIAKVMQSILEEHDSIGLNDLRKRGRKNVTSFSWEKMANETLAVYESCAPGGAK